MKKMIPQNKLSKKRKREEDLLKRNNWGDTNPITKVIPNKKHYNRKRDKRSDINERT